MENGVKIVASALKRSGAIRFGNFKLKSGVMSPYYIDLTWLLSSPNEFESVVNTVSEEAKIISASRHINKMASIELKGALLLPSIANRLKMPSIVVRKESKSYGLKGRIVGGEILRDDKILFFDDVVTDGRSKKEGIEPLEASGAVIKDILVVIDRQQGGKRNLNEMGYELSSIATISEIVKSLVSTEELHEGEAERILDYVGNMPF